MKHFIEEQADSMVRDLIRFINIPSVRGTATEKAPFGESINDALCHILDLAESRRLKTKNYSGYMGEITAKNAATKGTHTITGILCHLDVVDGGKGWETPPFQGQVKDGKLYGRGSLDDKGPIISCLYALQYLQEAEKIPPGIELRLILGTDEENNWEDMEYYLSHVVNLPDMSIVPDANFPMILCEKGLLDFDLTYCSDDRNEAPLQIISLNGGTARNVVPADAACTIEVRGQKMDQIIKLLENHEGLTVAANGSALKISASGQSTHCMSPEKGISAISYMMEALYDLGELTSHRDFITSYHNNIGSKYNGEKMGMDFSDQVSGKLTFNVGEIRFADGIFKLTSNIRYPASMTYEEMKTAVERFSKRSGFQYSEVDHLAPICHDDNAPLIQSLLSAYQLVTGDTDNKGFAIGGATYARALPNAVAFGPLFPGEEELAHEPNEFIDLDSLWNMTEIFITALERLMRDAEKGG